MAWRLNEIQSAIRSHISDGLQGVPNYAYSEEQIEREVIAERISIMLEMQIKNTLSLVGFTQSINGLKVDTSKLSKTSIASSEANVKHFKIPKIVTLLGEDAITFIGPITRNARSWKVYVENNYHLHKFKLSIHDKPFVWVDANPTNDGFYDCYIFNFPGSVQFISVTAVFENPVEIEDFGTVNVGDFPAPEWAVKEIITRITNRYVQYYRQLNAPIQPNTQTDKTS